MSYQLIFDGVDRTVLPGGAGVFVVNDADPFHTGTDVDALLFLAGIDSTPGGDRFLVLALAGPTNTWNTTALPTDYSFLCR